MLRLSAFVCFTTTTAALTASSPLSALRLSGFLQRTGKVVAQNTWATAVDEYGQTFYYNEQTGQSQWEPPPSIHVQQLYTPPVLWRAVPATGVCSEYAVTSCQEQVLGRADMVDQSLYVSRQQCLIQVAADGTATLVSVGKPPTLIRAHTGAPWYVLHRSTPLTDGIGCVSLGDGIGYVGAQHVLSHGEQVSLDIRNPEGAVFMITCDAQYVAQYSEDGNWTWNGTEWIPAAMPSERVRLYEVEDELCG